MTRSTTTPKKIILLASLGLVIPIFIVFVAFLAVSNDAKNQQEYQRIHAENLARIEAKKRTDEQAASEVTVKMP
jgi:uncharacterized membrane-anchored protein YhcB (DUF1043 family)